VNRVLLYSPDVIGHPRVYCRVIADSLADEHCEIVLAMGFTDEVGLTQSSDLLPLTARKGISILDNRTHSARGNPHLTAEELVDLQSRFEVATTLFIEGDKFNDEFLRIAAAEAPRLLGRNLAIFSKTAEWFPGEDSYSGEPKRLVAPTLRTTLGNVKRAIFERTKAAKYFYEKTILASGVLDEIFVKDERLAQWYGPPVYWMPEISRPIGDDEQDDCAEFVRRRGELDQFLQCNRGREPVLYFGDAAFYKGYDLFLEFVARTPSVSAIHPGRSYDAQQAAWFEYDVEVLRTKLRAEGRLYETNDYVSSRRLKDLYFGAIRLYITTHRLTLSSATVIQAAELGKPVLVPDRGLLGYRVRTNGIGRVYKYGDLNDLARQAQELWSSDLTRFSAPARAFWERFSDAAIREFFIRRLLGSS
jgi:glycosyltransferase involved in cell wall biosynthesis